MIVPSLFTIATPCLGAVTIDTLEEFIVPSILPAASFAKTFTVIAVPVLVVAISLLATGLSVTTDGSITVISNAVIGHPDV